MLCLKAEVLDEQDCLQHNQPSSPSTINNSGFVLPINLGSSIHRYLWKKGWSFSAGDGSLCPSDFEVSKLPNKTRGEKCLYKYQLEQDIKKLRQQLQEEIDLHLALASAVEHSDPTLSNSPCQLPDKAQDLLDSIAVLEITVSKLEQETVSLQYQLSQERNERRLAEYRLSHTSSTELSSFDSSQAHLPQLITRPRCEKSVEGEMKEMQALPNSIEEQNYNDSEDNLWHYPCRLSEEMVRCMRDIFLFLANSSKLTSSECIASPSSPQGHLSYSSMTSFSESPIIARSPSVDMENDPDIFARDRSFDPYGVPRKVDWTRNIGNYSMAVEVSWLSVGKKELEYAATALKRFRLFLEHLARVDLYCMTCNEKLAFWINLYNALIMHAYLAYGVPTSEMKLFSLIQKAAYTVGGHSFTAADIEFIILKMKPPAHRPQIALVLALQKFKASEELKKYSIDHHEPLLPFALSSGMHSSPAVRIYQPENVTELLKESLRDYVQASVGISNKGKLLVPKLLHCFAKGLVEDSSLPDWICQFLSEEHAAMVRKCSCHQKWRLPGARSFSVLPFDSRFRYLFLMEDGDCNSFASEM
ncbi:uncharacterized protein LOC116114049 [Pistacia vera]|uniref:uncharacterized protein LOC116114049 n=1 Tax=Pistacia vera TaxID=55513 RepID=UPI001262D172|nr:uncharacterized protein LOC116114049 [Pistacia vera]